MAAAQVRRRREQEYGSYSSCVLTLRALAAEAHLALGQLDEAEAALQKLAGQCLRPDVRLTLADVSRHGVGMLLFQAAVAIRGKDCDWARWMQYPIPFPSSAVQMACSNLDNFMAGMQAMAP